MASGNEKTTITIGIESDEPVATADGVKPPKVLFDVVYQKLVTITPKTNTSEVPANPPEGNTMGTSGTSPGTTQSFMVEDTLRSDLDATFKSHCSLARCRYFKQDPCHDLGHRGMTLAIEAGLPIVYIPPSGWNLVDRQSINSHLTYSVPLLVIIRVNFLGFDGVTLATSTLETLKADNDGHLSVKLHYRREKDL